MQEYGYCRLSLVPVRAEGKEVAEMVTQLLFGDLYQVLEWSASREWVRIRQQADGYEGWIGHRLHHPISEAFYLEAQERPPVVSLEICGQLRIPGHRLQLVLGSTLPLGGQELFQDEHTVTFSGKTHAIRKIKDAALLKEFAFMYIDSPYLWGGKSPFGIDCSGFTQMVYKLGGYQLQRDASQQAREGVLVPTVAEARPGDLAFFHNPQGRITHVGLVLDGEKIIHASGRVRIDRLDSTGIYCEEEKHYTHTLSLIKRIIM
ncbi:C40 family peptidase [Cesiribacter andamanensis]|uniref:Gamma-D-glutamyl-L-lysine endopeptidase n=1 Tax=Cesiribacter andamanensis AMV16 TaxID=1279009 RepID=M7NQY8_9BACT|nr:C40 family peptidase [Cesiribacter andamanensis]EMR04130.1 Gamma-D-glutamyl-L-lysine endopeptidase [Cesiribacter andamanensis AMV16]